MPDPDVRFSLANERTLLAYHRTAIGLVGAAVVVAHFLPESNVARLLAFVLLVAGGLSAVGGVLRYRSADRAIREGRAIPVGVVPYVVTVAIVVTIGLAATWLLGAPK